MNTLRAAEILIEKIKKDYQEDIACVMIMGSTIYNETHSRSDLDMYFVPKTERGFNLAKVFIIDGIGFDFWPISWNRLERIANHDERITSIITEGKMIYYGSDEDLERFNQVKAKALDVSDHNKFIQKAQEKLNDCYKTYFKLLKATTLSDVRIYAMEIIFSITYAIALLNKNTVKRGRGKLKKEILNMPLVPNDFETLYDTVFTSSDLERIKQAYGQLISNMEILIEQNIKIESSSISDHLTGYYEEIINFYNKINHACEMGDSVTALFAAVEITTEFDEQTRGTGLSARKDLPDIVGAYDPNNSDLFLKLVREHQIKTVEIIENNGIKMNTFRDFDELEQFIHSL